MVKFKCIFFQCAIRTVVRSHPHFHTCDRVRLKFLEPGNDRCYLLIPINACTSAANNRLYYSENAIKGGVQREIMCLQTDQSKVMRFFNVIIRLT